MPACLSRALASSFSTTSPINMGCDHQQESMPISFSNQQQQQLGIVSILGSNNNDSIESCTSSSFPDYNCHLNENQLIIKSSNNSIRRTLSADMSSQKWLSNNGHSSPSKMKRIGSTHEFQTSKEDDSDSTSEGRAFEDIWSSIQSNKKEAEPLSAAAPASLDIWSSIIASKNENNDDSSKSGSSVALPPPYVHPSVKRASSTLSERSLEICTESLGSETGSDGFSSYTSSDPEPESDSEDGEEQQQLQLQQQTPVVDQQGLAYVGIGAEELHVPKYNYNIASTKRVSAKSFPPPLPSLAHRDGTNLHMRSHRQNGRLVLEAVSVPSQNCFRSQRQDGRLLLTLAPSSTESPEKDTIEVAGEKVITNDVDEEENDINEIDLEETDECSTDSDEEDEEEDAFERDKNNNVGANNGLSTMMADHLVAKCSKGSMINMQADGKVVGLISRNNNQSIRPDHNNKRFNKVVTKTTALDRAAKEQPTTVPQKSLALASSLPPRPKTVCRRLITDTASTTPATPTSLHQNTYEYYWRKTKPPIPGPTKASLTTTKNQDAFLHGCRTGSIGCGSPQNATMIKEIGKRKNKFITKNVVPVAFKGMSTSPIVEQKQQQIQQQNHQDQLSNLMVVNKARSGGGEYLVPLLMQQGCKEARSLLFWEPYCIATT